MNKIVSFFPNSDLRCSHNGLTELAKKARKDPNALTDGQFLVFVSKSQCHAKVLAKDNVLVHVRGDGRRRLSLTALNELPSHFGGGSFDYTAALGETMRKYFERSGRSLQ